MSDEPVQVAEEEEEEDALGTRERWRFVWRRFRKDVKRRQRTLVAGMGFSLLLALTRVIEPWPLKIVFDQVLFHRAAHGFLTRGFLVNGSTPTDVLTVAAIVLVLTGVVHGLAYYYQDFLLSSAAQDIVYAIRGRLYRHLQRLPLSFHVSRHVGDTLVRLSTDIILLRDVLIDFIVNLGAGAVMLVLMLTVMFIVDPLLTALVLITMPAAFVITYVYGDQIRIRSRKQRKREGEVGALMHESIAAMSVVQLHGAEEREYERFRLANKRSLSQGTKAIRLEAKMNRAIEIALACGMVVVLWVGTFQAIHGHISPGTLVVFISYVRTAYRPLRRGSKTVQRSAKALAAAERIAEVLEIEPTIRDADDAVAMAPIASELCFDDVHFAYDEEREVLAGVTLSLPVGRRIAVVGPTGSGKSTLLRLIPRLYDPTAGRVTIDGVDLRDATLASVRSQVAMVEQDAVLMSMSIAANIRYGRPGASDEEVAAAAEAAGLGPALEQLPHGLDTEVAERGGSLSGGERQRVTIARALLRDAPILLLDEPTTGLDQATKRGVVDALLGLLAGRTAVIVTHDLELARQADEIVLLVDGRIAGEGTYDDLLEGSAAFRDLAQAMAPETAS